MAEQKSAEVAKDRVCLVTGASKGFGFLMAQGLAKAGYKVYGASRSKPADECNFTFVAMDVTKDDSVKAAIETIMAVEGKIDVLVNNAGGALPLQSVQNTVLDDVRRCFELNYFGTIRVTQAVLPVMLKNKKSGHIINITSCLSTAALPFASAYSAAKAAVDRTTEGLAAELVDTNITVQAISPGYCSGNSNFHATTMSKIADNDEAYKEALQRTLGNMGIYGPFDVKPQDVADLLVKMVNKEDGATGFRCYPEISLKQMEWQNTNFSSTYQHNYDLGLTFTAKRADK